MNNEAKPKNAPTNNRQVSYAQRQLSAPELVQLMKDAKSLRKEFRPLRPAHGTSTEAITTAQALLKIWSDEVDASLSAEQAKDIDRRLRTWDNEGGAVDHAPKKRVLSTTAS